MCCAGAQCSGRRNLKVEPCSRPLASSDPCVLYAVTLHRRRAVPGRAEPEGGAALLALFRQVTTCVPVHPETRLRGRPGGQVRVNLQTSQCFEDDADSETCAAASPVRFSCARQLPAVAAPVQQGRMQHLWRSQVDAAYSHLLRFICECISARSAA